jgi:FlaA1/EpsC-like NDP-sugar epimerase
MQRAAQLLMLALSDEFASGIFVPELGEPVLVEKIARCMLAEAASPLKIVFIGLRPGDKLAEKLISTEEAYLPGADASLRSVRSPLLPFEELRAAMQELEKAIKGRDLAHLLRVVSQLVPDYTPSGVIGNALREVAAAR